MTQQQFQRLFAILELIIQIVQKLPNGVQWSVTIEIQRILLR